MTTRKPPYKKGGYTEKQLATYIKKVDAEIASLQKKLDALKTKAKK